MRLDLIRALLVAVVAALGLAVLTPLSASAASTWTVPKTRAEHTATSLDEFEVQLMVEVNRARRAHGLKRIPRFDRCVDRMAEAWGARIARTGSFEHRNQREVLRRCRASWAGENLIRGSRLSPEAMVQAWLDSPGHRAIMLSRLATRAGVAVTQDAQGRYVGVLNVVRHR